MKRRLTTRLLGEARGFLASFMPHRYIKATRMATNAKWHLIEQFSSVGIVREHGSLMPHQMEAVEILAMAERCAQFGAAVLRE